MRIVFDLQGAQSGSKTRGIGRYSLNLARALATVATDHEFWILLTGGGTPQSVADLRAEFDGLVPQERIRVFEIPGPVWPLNPRHVWAIRAAERIREHVIATLRPDAVVVGSLFEGQGEDEGVVTSVGELIGGERTAVVLYDLIPYQVPREYLINREYRVHYARKIDSLLNAGLLLAISDHSRQEAIELLGIDGEKVVSIGAAASATFMPVERSETVLPRLGVDRPYVLCCPSGFEPRKNVERLIAAFGALPGGLRADFQLVLASRIDEAERIRLTKVVEHNGLTRGDVVFTGHVDDSDLLSLYAAAFLCVVPSLREGFGLPALEAMNCGAPVIGSNTTSLPEAIGREDALFDPESVEAMRDLIERVMVDDTFRDVLVQHAHEHARKFSWEITARKALAALEVHGDAPKEHPRLRIAVVGPPADGVSLADRRIEDLLRDRHDLDLYETEIPHDQSVGYHHVLYVATGRSSLESIAEWVTRQPGVVVLHDPIDESVIASCASWLNAARGVVATDGRVHGQLIRWFGSQSARTLRLIETDGNARPADKVAQELVDFLDSTGEPQDALLSRLVDSIGTLPELSEQPERYPAVAWAIAESTVPAFRLRQLLVDITVLVEHDARTGVQRVVRAQLEALLRRPEPGISVEPVYFKNVDGTPVLHYARGFTSRFLGRDASASQDEVAEVRVNDIYYAPDLSHAGVLAAHGAGIFDRWRSRGVRIAFLVYDMLPILRPEFFVQVPNLTAMHRDWLQVVADKADRIVCISQSVAVELRDWLRDAGHPRADAVEITHSHLGHDIVASKPTTGSPDDGPEILARLAARPSILMVGTVEPRKGYRQAVAGMDELWDEGIDANLVIVGKPGWDPSLTKYLGGHPEIHKRLLWLSDLSDEFLTQVYASSTGLLLASEGEGFGLPLVEAAHHRLPILVRDLPVTREVAGEGATYFSGLTPAELAGALRAWLPQAVSGTAPSSELVQRRTWADHADDVVRQLLTGWDRQA